MIITTLDEQVTAKQLEPLITPRYYHACATYNLGHTQVLIEIGITRLNWLSLVPQPTYCWKWLFQVRCLNWLDKDGNHEHRLLQFLAVVGGESVQQELDSTEVIKMRGVSAQLLQSKFRLLDIFVTRWHFPSGDGLHKWWILENCGSLAFNKIWTQGCLHWWTVVCESTLIKFVLLFLLLCPHRPSTMSAQSIVPNEWELTLTELTLFDDGSISRRAMGSPVRYIDMTYRLSIYRHFWKISISISISIWSFLKISISIRQFQKYRYRYRYGDFGKYRYRYR